MSVPVENAEPGSERLFVSIRSAASGRHAILEDDGVAVWLYLTGPADTTPVSDGLVYSVVPPTEEFESPQDTSGPPILLRLFASEVAWQPGVPVAFHRIEFSSDGHSVAVFVRSEPWAFIARDEARGYSRSISAIGPFGQPWSQELFDQLFPFNRTC